MGKNLLRKQARLNMSFKDLHRNPLQQQPAGQVVQCATGLTPSTSIADLLTVNEHMEVSLSHFIVIWSQSSSFFVIIIIIIIIVSPIIGIDVET